MTFTVPGEPVAWQRAGYNQRKRAFYTPTKTRNYQTKIRFYARSHHVAQTTRPVAVYIDIFFRTSRRKDTDNVVKSVLDALNGIAYADDSQVVGIHATKQVDHDNPRVEIRIELAETLVEPGRESDIALELFNDFCAVAKPGGATVRETMQLWKSFGLPAFQTLAQAVRVLNVPENATRLRVEIERLKGAMK